MRAKEAWVLTDDVPGGQRGRRAEKRGRGVEGKEGRGAIVAEGQGRGAGQRSRSECVSGRVCVSVDERNGLERGLHVYLPQMRRLHVK